MAMAETNSKTFRRSAPSPPFSPATSLWRWGTTLSMTFRNKAPAKIPAVVMSNPKFPPYSKEGRISPSTAAASITPAAKAMT